MTRLYAGWCSRIARLCVLAVAVALLAAPAVAQDDEGDDGGCPELIDPNGFGVALGPESREAASGRAAIVCYYDAPLFVIWSDTGRAWPAWRRAQEVAKRLSGGAWLAGGEQATYEDIHLGVDEYGDYVIFLDAVAPYRPQWYGRDRNVIVTIDPGFARHDEMPLRACARWWRDHFRKLCNYGYIPAEVLTATGAPERAARGEDEEPTIAEEFSAEQLKELVPPEGYDGTEPWTVETGDDMVDPDEDPGQTGGADTRPSGGGSGQPDPGPRRGR